MVCLKYMCRKIIFLISFLFLASCGDNQIEKADMKSIPTVVGKNVTMFYSDSGATQLKITTPLRQTYTVDTSYTLMPKGFKAQMLHKDSVTADIKANWGSYITKNKLLEMKDSVVVKNKKGEILKTDYLIWKETEKKIYTYAPVTIQRGQQIIYGDSLVANQDFSQYKILKPKGIIYSKNQ